MGKDKDMLTEAGIIIEDPGFLRNWSAYHNLEFLYTIRNRPDKSYLHSVLNTVGLDSKLKTPGWKILAWYAAEAGTCPGYYGRSTNPDLG